MKLLRLQINNQFRSLPAGFQIEFRKPGEDFEKNLHEPICLVGINGSGKSNVLEALAEIFSYIDQVFLKYVLDHSDSPVINSFELEYMLPFAYGMNFFEMNTTFGPDYLHIKIVKDADLKPLFFLVQDGELKQITEKFTSALPDRVIGYSSGQNELLSIPFYKVKFRYYNTLLQEQKTTYREAVEYSRLRYIDYNENASILLSNYLMIKHDGLSIFKEKLFIVDIADFEITINRNQPKRGVLKVDKDIEKLLSFLKDIASTRYKIEEGIERLSYIVTPDLKKAFQDNFLDASGLYTLFKRLGYLNLNSIKKKQIESLLAAQQEVYEDYRITDFSPDKELFQISGIGIKKADIPYPISYRNLSDGEHQFVHIVGTLMMMKEESALFLFDEPETHFNPRWKYEYTETFKKVTSGQKSQILLTTHDPVLISGLAKENVIVFNRPEEGTERTFKPDQDLKGMGVDAILTSEIFGLNSTLDSVTFTEMIERRKLLAKQEKEVLSNEENQELKRLSEHLKDIDFNIPFADPLYKDFILALESLDVYKRIDLSTEEVKEREQIAKEVMQKLNDQGL